MRFQDKRAVMHQLLSRYLGHHELIPLLDASKVGVVICDRQLRYKALNQSVADMHNEPIKAHLGRPLGKILGNFAEQVVPFWQNVLVSGHSYTNLEVTGKLPKRSATGRWVQNFFPLLDKKGRVEYVGCFAIEIRPDHLLSPQSFKKPKSTAETQPLHPDRPKRTVLSGRELEVLRLIAVGERAKDIALVLRISFRTVETYRSRLMLKLGASSIVELVHYAIQNHIV